MVKAVDLVDKKHVALVEVGQDRGKIARTLDRRAARHLDLRPHGVGDDVRKRGFPQTGGTV